MAVLQRQAPIANADGTTPVNIAGYNVYRLTPVGAAQYLTGINLYTLIPPANVGDMATIVGAPPPPITFTASPLSTGTYCYAVTALNFPALQSAPAFLSTPLTVI